MCDFQSIPILVVDDSPTNLAVFSSTLRNAGFKVRVAVDGVSAIAKAEYDPPGLILLDVNMPTIDGFETCIKLKANPITSDIPIIFITGLSDREDKLKGFSLGAVDYITKPFQEEEVLARVRIHLKLRFLTQKVAEQAAELQKANQELLRLTIIDDLTQIANRRRFNEYLKQEWERSQREQEPISLILCDVDYFKHYNDTYGHLAGDICLHQIAQALSRVIKRPADLVARYGGEEFVIILSNTDSFDLVKIVRQIQTEIEQIKISHSMSKVSKHITLSIGAGCQTPNLEQSSESLFKLVDSALYTAKSQGRNRCSFYTDNLENE